MQVRWRLMGNKTVPTQGDRVKLAQYEEMYAAALDLARDHSKKNTRSIHWARPAAAAAATT